MNLFEILVVVLIVVIAAGFITGKLDANKIKNLLADLKDDGKLNGSNAAPPVYVPPPEAVPDHAAIVTAALAGAAAVTSAAVGKPAVVSLDSVHDQASLDAYRAYLEKTNRGLLAYTPTVYKEVEPSTNGDAALMGTPLTFANGVATEPLTLHVRRLFKGTTGAWLTFQLPSNATNVIIQPASTTTANADAVKYNLVAVDLSGNTVAGSAAAEYQYNAAVLRFGDNAVAVRVRALVVDNVDAYIQVN